MIKSITLRNVASYGDEPQKLDGLERVNFIFGANGSGKTTISRLLHEENSQPSVTNDFASCTVDYESNARPEILVYNRDFIERNFGTVSTLKGIFTIGEESVEHEEQLQRLQRQKAERETERDTLIKQLDGNGESVCGAKQDLVTLTEDFEGQLWDKTKALRKDFPESFTGFRNSGAKFKQEVLKLHLELECKNHDLNELRTQYTLLYSQEPAARSTYPLLNADKLRNIEHEEILEKVIAGSADAPIGKLIQELQHSAWVKQGTEYFKRLDHEKCPFCQQETSPSLRQQLTDFFNESFEKDKRTVESLAGQYEEAGQQLLKYVAELIEKNDHHIFKRSIDLSRLHRELLDVLRTNQERFKGKVNALETRVELLSSSRLINEVNEIIGQINEDIERDNAALKSRKKSREALRKAVWEHLLFEQKTRIATYQKKKNALTQKINGLSHSLQSSEEKIKTLQRDIKDIEAKRTDIRKTVRDINGILQEYGFTNFSLRIADDNSSYDIIRSNGKLAKNSLSEGEKTFLVFLYYYHLINGSHNESGQSTDRILVIDDPVSSLDSQVLFIVSSLLKKLRAQVLNKNASSTSIKQIIFFTHNAYFHQAISTAKKSEKAHFRFWIVRRAGQTSKIQYFCKNNPIKSSYEYLWQDVRNAQENKVQATSPSLRNLMRRILEYYFVHLGTQDNIRTVSETFGAAEKRICASLIDWLHDGSHRIAEDIDYTVHDATVEMYLSVFERIFKDTGHHAHYEMMMQKVTPSKAAS